MLAVNGSLFYYQLVLWEISSVITIKSAANIVFVASYSSVELIILEWTNVYIIKLLR